MRNRNVRQGDVVNLDIVVPLVEQLDVADLLSNILGKDVGDDLDITALRHFEYVTVDVSVTWRGTVVSITRDVEIGFFRDWRLALR